MKLLHKDGREVKEGDSVTDFRGNPAVVMYVVRPRHSGSTGRVAVKHDGYGPHEYFPSAYDLVWGEKTMLEMNYSYSIYLDNGGGLTLQVYGNKEKALYGHYFEGSESGIHGLIACVLALFASRIDTPPEEWDGNQEDCRLLELSDDERRNGGYRQIFDLAKADINSSWKNEVDLARIWREVCTSCQTTN